MFCTWWRRETSPLDINVRRAKNLYADSGYVRPHQNDMGDCL
jgi:hypothetical protein